MLSDNFKFLIFMPEKLLMLIQGLDFNLSPGLFLINIIITIIIIFTRSNSNFSLIHFLSNIFLLSLLNKIYSKMSLSLGSKNLSFYAAFARLNSLEVLSYRHNILNSGCYMKALICCKGQPES